MDDAFKIYVEQLRDGHIEKIDEVFPSDILGVHEKDLDYEDDVLVKGDAYLAEENLILNLSISTFAILPCTICNEPVRVKVEVNRLYHAIPLEEIKGGVYSFKELVREAVILESPVFAECEGKCPRRQELARYFRKKVPPSEGPSDHDGYQPFANLDWDDTKKD
jgi:uncharacterized metal-binding protein YceD (DUF177 family)